MTEEELREKLHHLIFTSFLRYSQEYKYPFDYQKVVYSILTLVKEAGWKSAEEVREYINTHRLTLHSTIHSIGDRDACD